MGTTIQSLERGLQILDILGAGSQPLSLNEIAGHFSIDRSSVFRLVSTLLKCGYVIQDEATKRYSLSYRVLELAGVFSCQSNIEALIKPVMRDVIGETNQNTHLAVLDGDQVIFLMVEHPRDHLSLNITVGLREPAVVTALGRSLLAFQPAEYLDQMLSGHQFIHYTDRSIQNRTQLKKCLKTVKRDLVAVDDEEYRPGIMCIAAPVFDHSRKARYSLGITGLREVIKPCLESYRTSVRTAGIRASELLGYRR